MALPGGCNIGSRPIDFHINGFKKLGAEVTIEGNKYIFKVDNEQKQKINEFFYPWCHGGFCSLNQDYIDKEIKDTNLKSYDVCSLYPSVCAFNDLPYGPFKTLTNFSNSVMLLTISFLAACFFTNCNLFSLNIPHIVHNQYFHQFHLIFLLFLILFLRRIHLHQ